MYEEISYDKSYADTKTEYDDPPVIISIDMHAIDRELIKKPSQHNDEDRIGVIGDGRYDRERYWTKREAPDREE
jgi:hypothetical protein